MSGMGNDVEMVPDVPLSDAEEAAWDLLVREGARIRAPMLERRAERRAVIDRRAAARGEVPYRDSMASVPDRVRRWVVLRFAGASFRRAGAESGATWLEVQEARARNESFRCALAAQEDNSRQLMLAKAQSVVEQSQEEDAKVSLAQAQLAMRILSSLDRPHFGEPSECGPGAATLPGGDGGGFVINVIGDAAAACAKPVEAKGRALVYTEV